MTGSVSGLDLEAIEKRADAATDGPWSAKNEWVIRSNDDDPWSVAEVTAVDERGGVARACADAEFIAAARTDVPALLAEVRRLQAVEKAVTEVVQLWPSHRPTLPTSRFEKAVCRQQIEAALAAGGAV